MKSTPKTVPLKCWKIDTAQALHISVKTVERRLAKGLLRPNIVRRSGTYVDVQV